MNTYSDNELYVVPQPISVMVNGTLIRAMQHPDAAWLNRIPSHYASALAWMLYRKPFSKSTNTTWNLCLVVSRFVTIALG